MDSSYKIPGGGLVTTAEDLVLFATAMMDNKIVKAETLAAMWSPTKLRDGQMSPYGLGFAVQTPGGERFVGHGGSQQGTTTTLAILPGKRFAVAALANMDGVNPAAVTNAILDLYHMPRPGK
jgi:CubicO group peptidase (beta-lactamase class C family)